MIKVDWKNPRALFEQVKDGFKELIIQKVLKEEEQLPSIRELAVSLSINPNTIQRAYRELEAEGFIYSVSGKGCFVAPNVKKDNPHRQKTLLDDFRRISGELMYMGVPQDELCKILKENDTK